MLECFIQSKRTKIISHATYLTKKKEKRKNNNKNILLLLQLKETIIKTKNINNNYLLCINYL